MKKQAIVFFIIALIALPLYAASTKISGMSDGSASITSITEVPVVRGGANEKVTVEALHNNAVLTATTATTGVDARTVTLNNGSTPNKWTLTNVLAWIRGKLDSVYQALDSDLTSLAGQSGTGISARTTSNTWTTRTITGTSNEVTVTNGDGISGNPTIELPDAVTIGGAMTAGSFTTPQSAVNPDSTLLRGPGTSNLGVTYKGPAAEPAVPWSLQESSTTPYVGALVYIESSTGASDFVKGYSNTINILDMSSGTTSKPFIAGTNTAPTALGSVYLNSSTKEYTIGDGTTAMVIPVNIPGATTHAVYSAGTVYALTGSSAALTFGTTSPALTIPKAGRWHIHATARLEYNGATLAASQLCTVKLRRTNNTAADLTNGTGYVRTGVVTTVTDSVGLVDIDIDYTTSNGDDIIAMYGSLATTTSAGSIDCVAAKIYAQRIGSN
jgi:uncharacterized membrane protein YtjA (UPF0391 family)